MSAPITLTVVGWKDLALVLDSIPQKDLKSIKDVRQCQGAIVQIRKAILTEMAEFDSVQNQIEKVQKDFQEKLGEISTMSDKEAQKEAQDAAARQGNETLKSLNLEIEKLNEKYKDVDASVDLDGNYKNFIKLNFNSCIRPKYNKKDALIAVADALEIEE